MFYKFPKWVKLGDKHIIQEFVSLGQGADSSGDLIIGDCSVIRSGTVIYRGTVIGAKFNTGHGVLIRGRNIIGDNVSIGTNTVLEPGNKIGNYTRIHSNCFLENIRLGEYVYVGPNVTFLDDLHPICPRYEECLKGAIVGDKTAIGGGSIILPGVKIGSNVLVGAGSVVTKDIPDGEVWLGNPAKYHKKLEELRCHKGFYDKVLVGVWRRVNDG